MKGFTSEDDLATDDNEFLGVLKGWHEAAKKNRQIMDWNWYLYDNYYRGNHYIQFNKRTNQIVIPPRQRGQVRLVINKIYATCRAIRNFATSYRPKWEVAANSTTEDVINNARKSQETLDYYYDYLKIMKLSKGLVMYMIKYGIGFFQYGFDEEAIGVDGEVGEVDVWIRDPFDVYLDPSGMETGDIQNCRFIDIAISKPVQDIVNNPDYKKIKMDEVSGDTQRAASEFKQTMIRNQYANDSTENDELKTKILHETLYKKRVKDKKDKDGDADTYHSEVWIASWIEGHLLRNDRTEFDRYNLIPVASDDNPNEIYGEGYIKNLIPIAKIRNREESQIVEYNNIINRGRILAEKGSGVSKITNETGEIIEYNSGKTVTEFHPGGLAPDLAQQIARLNQYEQEISGVQDAFMGKTPEGVKSGVALESLTAQTANNLQDLKDNLETGLAQLGEAILEMISSKYITSRQIRSTGKDGKPEYFKIKGQAGVKPNENLPSDTYVIGKQNQVKVVIGSGLAYTKEGRTTRLDKLLEQKVIGPEAYLKGIEFGDVEDTIKEATQSQFNDAMLQKIGKDGMPTGPGGTYPPPAPPMGAPAGQPPQGAPQGQPAANGDSWAKLAQDENQAMMNGQDVPSTKGAPKEHTVIHIQYSQSQEAQKDDALLQRLLDHIRGEEQLQGIGAAPGAASMAGGIPPPAAPTAPPQGATNA